MSKYQAMYHTPLGFKLHDFEAESSEAAWDVAMKKCQFGLVELISVQNLGDKPAHQSRKKPFCRVGGKFHREVVTSREHDESRGGVDGIAVGAKDWLAVGDSDEVKLVHLGKHACLVYSPRGIEVREAGMDVAALSGVPSDSEQVDG